METYLAQDWCRLFGHADSDGDYCPRCGDWLPERTVRRAVYESMKALGLRARRQPGQSVRPSDVAAMRED